MKLRQDVYRFKFGTWRGRWPTLVANDRRQTGAVNCCSVVLVDVVSLPRGSEEWVRGRKRATRSETAERGMAKLFGTMSC